MMRKNLFSKTTKTTFANVTIAKYFLCVLLFLPIFSYAASSVDQDPSLPDQLSGVVYVSNSTTMYGADQMYIVTNKDANEKQIVATAKPAVKPVAISKEAIEHEEKIKAEKFKKEFPPVKAQVFVNNSSTNSSLLAAKQTAAWQATMPTTNPQKQIFVSTFFNSLLTTSVASQLSKQKYYVALSYLQFGKFRSASLRAPPGI